MPAPVLSVGSTVNADPTDKPTSNPTASNPDNTDIIEL